MQSNMYLVGLHIYYKMIHGPYNSKLITAQQAKEIRVYESINMKLYKCIAEIWYNKTCKLRHLTPRYIHIAINTLCVSCWTAYILTFWRRNFFQILAHPVFKMWVIQKPNKVALWNKRHFEEEQMEIIQHV